MADQIRANMQVRTRGRAFGSLFDRWGRHALSRGVAITNPEDSVGGDVVSVRLEDGSVLPYGVDELEPAPSERPERGPLASASDDDVAREFWRRFRPIQVHMGKWRGRAAVAELEDDDIWISEALPDGAGREGHAAGEPGFVAAVLRAREFVRKGGA